MNNFTHTPDGTERGNHPEHTCHANIFCGALPAVAQRDCQACQAQTTQAVTIDFCWDENVEAEVQDWLENRGLPALHFEVVEETGPAGGAAVVTFHGSPEEIANILRAYDPEPEEIDANEGTEFAERHPLVKFPEVKVDFPADLLLIRGLAGAALQALEDENEGEFKGAVAELHRRVCQLEIRVQDM